MKLVDKKCRECGRVYEYMIESDVDFCKCGKPLFRIFSVKPEIFKAGFYENFEFEPIYIETKKQFQKELDKRGLVRVF